MYMAELKVSQNVTQLARSPLSFLKVSLGYFTWGVVISVVGVARNSNGDKLEGTTEVTSSRGSNRGCEAVDWDAVDHTTPLGTSYTMEQKCN